MEREARRKYFESRARRLCARPPAPFRRHAEMLEAARVTFGLRELSDSARDPLEDRMTDRLHQRLRMTGPALHLSEVMRRRRLNHVEREIVLAMALRAIGIIDTGVGFDSLQSIVGNHHAKHALATARALQPEARLVSSGLVVLENNGIGENPEPAPELIGPLLARGGKNGGCWKVRNYGELLDRSFGLFSALQERIEYMAMDRLFRHAGSEAIKCGRKITRLSITFWNTVERHPEWPLIRLMRAELDREDLFILIMLIGKELGFAPSDSEVFLGEGLAQAASNAVPEVRRNLERLTRRRRLRKQGLIRVCGGYGDAEAIEDETTLRTCEFELTAETLAQLGVRSHRRHRRTKNSAHTPMVRLEQLVLSEGTRGAIRMAAAQIRHRDVMFNRWGLGKTVVYGRGVTALFSGPPGVGKTASAEAIASELGKPIITANYAEIQSCWVGETEKNIARLFREAADAGAVLFFDEADAMFYDRDTAYRNWEVRDVNMLLQQIEQFEGVCIVATNRKVALDKALARRIAVKVEFERPDRAMRTEIWKRLLPKKIPLAHDVDFCRLAEVDLSGGEIKNVILNAARLALCRDPEGKLTMADFEEAVRMETNERSSAEGKAVVGFKRR
jgi:AAA+ superfamily predicted ATPase